jgi:hypothetical protein
MAADYADYTDHEMAADYADYADHEQPRVTRIT